MWQACRCAWSQCAIGGPRRSEPKSTASFARRAAGVDCAQWEAGSTETILATAIDGAATQGFLLVSPAGRKKTDLVDPDQGRRRRCLQWRAGITSSHRGRTQPRLHGNACSRRGDESYVFFVEIITKGAVDKVGAVPTALSRSRERVTIWRCSGLAVSKPIRSSLTARSQKSSMECDALACGFCPALTGLPTMQTESLGEVSLNRRNVTLHLSLNQLFPADTESPSKGFRLRPKKHRCIRLLRGRPRLTLLPRAP